ncbi:MAG: SusC/RagA family TonB-linked outer membrane protein, partial [Cyclobacteriaceae bacterium]|nr:SusC/RagA family TonB-linked outer membrane protein [Cyclobacteriaceae bacterium]
MKKSLLSIFMAVFVFSTTLAQERSISGKVTSQEDGGALPGVTVLLKGTSQGTSTDSDGNFALNVSGDNGVLVFSFIGFASQEVTIGSQSVINVQLVTDVTQLSEVVVTALGVTREKASLGYSTQQINSDAVNTAKENNFINSLSGKVSGVQIRQNNGMGGSTNIVIRGNNSITGNNQPLFVVDGIPIDNRTGNDRYQQRGRYGYDYGNAASDVNPDDIESINVLKGAAAAALYGSRASNGVVIITTKKGKKRDGLGISFSTGLTAGTILPSTFIEYQKEYGAGYGPYYGSQGTFDDYVDVDGDGVVDNVVPTYEDASMGAKFDPNLSVYHWDSFVPESPNYMKKYPWVAAEHDPTDFFETAITKNNSISLSGGNDGTTFRVSYTRYNTTGILPNSQIIKNNFSFNGSSKINSKLTASVLLNYNSNSGLGRYSTGYSDNLMSQFRQWWQTNVDILAQKEIFDKTGRNVTWNMYDAAGGDYAPIYWDNPYWTRYKNYQTDTRDRTMGNTQLNYKITDWLEATGRVSVDRYTELRELRRAVGSTAQEFGVTKADASSGYERQDIFVSETNFDFMLSMNKELATDVTLYGMVGTNVRKNRLESVLASTNGGLAIPGLYALSNSLLTPPLPLENLLEKEVYGYFANFNLGIKDMFYVDLTDRYDISSSLPIGSNAYNYFSGALSFVLTEAVDLSWMNFGKVRLSYAEVGNDTDPLRTKDVYLRNDNFGNTIISTASSYRRNPDLLPERLKSVELGIEGALLDSRLTADVSVYSTKAEDQIMEIEVSRATGYQYKYVNGGVVSNKGVELVLGGDVVKSSDFKWNVSLNWSKNVSLVESLSEGVDNFVIGSYQGGISLNATVGEPFGVLRGTGYKLHDNGQRLVHSSGRFYLCEADQIIGDPNP